MTNPLNETTVVAQAKQALDVSAAKAANGKTELAIMVALALSSLFTIIYIVAALGASLIELRWSGLVSYGVSGLLGLAAIMPGEMALWVWKTKLNSDVEINDDQVRIAWVAGVIAAISAAVSTVSFFAYLLQGLMPGWYNAETAAGINVVNIALSWAVFGLAVFIYSAAGDASGRNKKRAKALHLVKDSQDEMIMGLAVGIKREMDRLVNDMVTGGIFVEDAMEQVAVAMGLSDERRRQVTAQVRPEVGSLPSAVPSGFNEDEQGFYTSPEESPMPINLADITDFDAGVNGRNGSGHDLRPM